MGRFPYWNSLVREFERRNEKQLMDLSEIGDRMNFLLDILSKLKEEEVNKNNLILYISEIDACRVQIFQKLLTISRNNRRLVEEIENITLNVMESQENLFKKTPYDEVSFLRYLTINKSFLNSLKKTLEDSLEYDKVKNNFTELLTYRLGCFAKPLSVLRKESRIIRPAEEKEEETSEFPKELEDLRL
ncbi:MAG TPA: hypothetical protein ENF49_00260 [Candidatus Altiarchaeales archaeon]|nr:hypothetical protein [Candidatus Altiarchaeales archaeon]HEX54551.1 hypothetical protein [Candidatus Altiarchaeales archaeon]